MHYGYKSWPELADYVDVRRQVRQRLGHWERFGAAEGWESTDDGKVERILRDPEWKQLVDAEISLTPLSPEAGRIRQQIASLERCHEHYVENLKAVVQMIGAMAPTVVLDCGQACRSVRDLASRYFQALQEWATAMLPPADADDVTAGVFGLLGPRGAEKQRWVGLLIAKLRDNTIAVSDGEDEDFTKVESRIQHLDICNYNWRENLRIVLKEIAVGRQLFPWHAPDGFNTHGDCPDRLAELRPLLAYAVAWAHGRPSEAGDLRDVLGELTSEKRWLIACLCKNVAAQHAKFGGEQALDKVLLR